MKSLYGFLLKEYEDKDILAQSSARFILNLAVTFIFLVVVLFVVFRNKMPIEQLLFTCCASWFASLVTIAVIKKGKQVLAGIILSYFLCLISVAAIFTRSPIMATNTILWFLFADVVLAVLYTPRWSSRIILLIACATMVINKIRFVPGTDLKSAFTEELLFRSLPMQLVTVLLVYLISSIAVKSLRIALDKSNEESEENKKKTQYIEKLLNSVKTSYLGLKDSIASTDSILNDFNNNMQSEAANMEEVAATIEEISANTSNVNDAVSHQNESVEDLTESFSNVSTSIDNLEKFGDNLKNKFNGLFSMAREGSENSKEINNINAKILQNSNQIESITDIIRDLFEQINLLSLNASIEAARAGDYGRGFAVVAEEIGKLSDNSASELGHINDIIGQNRRDVDTANDAIKKIVSFIESFLVTLGEINKEALETLKAISAQKSLQGDMYTKTENLKTKSDVIDKSSKEQSAAIDDIAKSIENTNSLVQNNTEHAENLRLSYEKIKNLAIELQSLVMNSQEGDN